MAGGLGVLELVVWALVWAGALLGNLGNAGVWGLVASGLDELLGGVRSTLGRGKGGIAGGGAGFLGCSGEGWACSGLFRMAAVEICLGSCFEGIGGLDSGCGPAGLVLSESGWCGLV